MTPAEFAQNYSPQLVAKIEFAWNGQHADGFKDANLEFRKAVKTYALANPSKTPLILVRDLLLAETAFAREAWGIDHRVRELATRLINEGRTEYYLDFIRSAANGFDAPMCCASAEIDSGVAAEIVADIDRRSADAIDDDQRRLLEYGRELFMNWTTR